VLCVSVSESGRLLQRVVLNQTTPIEMHACNRPLALAGPIVPLSGNSLPIPAKPLQYSPRLADDRPFSKYSNLANDILAVVPNFLSSGVSLDIIQLMTRRLHAHLMLLQSWSAIVQSGRRSNQGWSVHLGGLQDHVDGLFAKHKALLEHALSVSDGTITTADNTEWFQTQRDMNLTVSQLDGLDLDGPDEKAAKKALIGTLESHLRAASLAEFITVGQAKNLPATSQPYTLLLQAILAHLAGHSADPLPHHFQELLYRQLQEQHSVFKNWQWADIPPVAMSSDVRGMTPAERIKYQELYALNEKAQACCRETHRAVLRRTVTVTGGKALPQDNKDWFLYEDTLLKLLLQLDGVATLDQDRLRMARKAVVTYCQRHLSQLDALKTHYLLLYFLCRQPLIVAELSKVLEQITKGQAGSVQDEAAIRQALLASGMIDKLTEKVKAESKASIVPKPSLDAFINRPGPKSLRLTFVKGRALVGLRSMEPESNSALQVHVQFQTARFATKRVLSSIEPIFNETVEFDLPSKDVNLLVDLDCPIQIVLTESNVNGETQAVGVAQIEWRKVLHSGRISTLVELTDQLHPQITVGTLDIVLDFLPSDGERARRDEIEYHIKKQEQKKADVHTAFYLLAKQWWSDFLQIRPSHSTRLVKIFTNDEFGRRMPVSHFVGPLYCPWLETPRHAARFVSLIEYAPSKRIGESRLD
ncbi:Centrosomal protein of 76 kDa, partial [Kappamyces sp. JEL0680]